MKPGIPAAGGNGDPDNLAVGMVPGQHLAEEFWLSRGDGRLDIGGGRGCGAGVSRRDGGIAGIPGRQRESGGCNTGGVIVPDGILVKIRKRNIFTSSCEG